MLLYKISKRSPPPSKSSRYFTTWTTSPLSPMTPRVEHLDISCEFFHVVLCRFKDHDLSRQILSQTGIFRPVIAFISAVSLRGLYLRRDCWKWKAKGKVRVVTVDFLSSFYRYTFCYSYNGSGRPEEFGRFFNTVHEAQNSRNEENIIRKISLVLFN